MTLSAIGRYESPWIEFTNGKKLRRVPKVGPTGGLSFKGGFDGTRPSATNTPANCSAASIASALTLIIAKGGTISGP